jgi:hypothetical protein
MIGFQKLPIINVEEVQLGLAQADEQGIGASDRFLSNFVIDFVGLRGWGGLLPHAAIPALMPRT